MTLPASVSTLRVIAIATTPRRRTRATRNVLRGRYLPGSVPCHAISLRHSSNGFISPLVFKEEEMKFSFCVPFFISARAIIEETPSSRLRDSGGDERSGVQISTTTGNVCRNGQTSLTAIHRIAFWITRSRSQGKQNEPAVTKAQPATHMTCSPITFRQTTCCMALQS